MEKRRKIIVGSGGKRGEDGCDGEGYHGRGFADGSRETLRLLRAQEPSQAVSKQKIPRIWFIRVPRGFESMGSPYTVERANYDSLMILRDSMVETYIDVDSSWYPVGFGGSLVGK